MSQVFPAAPRQPGPPLHHLLLPQPAHHHNTLVPHLRQQGSIQTSTVLTIIRQSCTITEKAPTGAFSWLKAPTSAFTEGPSRGFLRDCEIFANLRLTSI